jgi:ABC-type sugar transport system substrate-binding protein
MHKKWRGQAFHMRKKIMAVALGIALCGSLLSGCTKTQESVENQETQTAQETPGLNGQEETAEAPTEIEAEADPEEEERNRQDVSTIGDRTRLYVMIPENSGASGREAEVIRATGEAAGYTVTIEEHEGNIHRQQTFFQEAMEDENTAAIICDHAGATKTADMVAEAKAAGIPTVLINTGIDVEGSAVAQILTDSYASVTEASRRYLEHLGGSGLYVEILGDTWNINAFQATTAFHDVASEYGDLLMDRQAIGSEYDLEDSKEKITRMLEESPDSKEAAEKVLDIAISN